MVCRAEQEQCKICTFSQEDTKLVEGSEDLQFLEQSLHCVIDHLDLKRKHFKHFMLTSLLSCSCDEVLHRAKNKCLIHLLLASETALVS